MLLRDLKEKFPQGEVKIWKSDEVNKRVFYMNPRHLYDYVGEIDWLKIRSWNGICIYPSPSGEPNECFYFYWGYGGNPEYPELIDIKC